MQDLTKWFTSLKSRQSAREIIDDQWRTVDMDCHRERLAHHWLTGNGIEIGALHQPVKLADGVEIRYVDYKTRVENQARYPELDGFEIVHTDIVDDGFILNNITDYSLDFLVANHALEHSPDPYGTLLKWKSKLRPYGMLYFALPIAEQCFDRGRLLTQLAHLVEDHRLFSTSDISRILDVTEGHLREFLRISDANIRRQNQISHIRDDQEIEQTCSDLMSVVRASVIKSDMKYDDLITAHVINLNKVYDIHYHTFSPSSLSEFVGYFCDNADCEIVELTKSGGGECIAILRNQSA